MGSPRNTTPFESLPKDRSYRLEQDISDTLTHTSPNLNPSPCLPTSSASTSAPPRRSTRSSWPPRGEGRRQDGGQQAGHRPDRQEGRREEHQERQGVQRGRAHLHNGDRRRRHHLRPKVQEDVKLVCRQLANLTDGKVM